MKDMPATIGVIFEYLVHKIGKQLTLDLPRGNQRLDQIVAEQEALINAPFR